MFRIRQPTVDTLEDLLARARRQQPSYPEVGATHDGELKSRYRLNYHEAALSPGRAAYERAVSALRAWQPQRGAGLTVWPTDAWVEEAETTLLVIRVGVLWSVAPCRVVYVDEQPDAFAFAYGTLPGHPERGEVAFSILQGAEETVTFRIASFSRPADPLARLGAPLARRLQRRVTRNYLTAMQDASRPSTDSRASRS